MPVRIGPHRRAAAGVREVPREGGAASARAAASPSADDVRVPARRENPSVAGCPLPNFNALEASFDQEAGGRGDKRRVDARDQGRALQTERPRGQGPGRAGASLSRDLVPSRPQLRHTSGLQRPARRLAASGQRPGPPADRLPASERIQADRSAMLSLPPVAPSTGWSYRLRLPRDHYVRLDSNDYRLSRSPPPARSGRTLAGSWIGRRSSA